ncbi:MAG: NYN domain-containing protein [Lutisporaceae bacterium]
MEKDKKIAVLIDADNVSAKYIKYIIDEILNHGIPTYKRIYGDWTQPQLNPWKDILLKYSISPIQQYSYTSGKNSTDSALIIDAMDILYSNNVEGFCIVSSDSDFTRLAARLRESGMYVMGIGEEKTPISFISACEKFKYLEVLASMDEKPAENSDIKQVQNQDESKIGVISKNKLIKAIKTIITEISDEDGWANLGVFGQRLNKKYPDFDTRNYGYTKLRPFVSSLNHFEFKFIKLNNQNLSYYIRNKE